MWTHVHSSKVEKVCDLAGITVNKNMIVGDKVRSRVAFVATKITA